MTHLSSNRRRKTLVVAGHGMVGHRFVQAAVERGLTETYDVVVVGEEPRPAYDLTMTEPGGKLFSDRLLWAGACLSGGIGLLNGFAKWYPNLPDIPVRIQDMGPRAVIITGGHGSGDDIVDLLLDDDEFHECATSRVHSRRSHGTGCAFASAVAASLALGRTLPDAAAGDRAGPAQP